MDKRKTWEEEGDSKNFSIILIIFEIAFNTSWPEPVLTVVVVIAVLLVVRKTINGNACTARLGDRRQVARLATSTTT